MIDHNFFIEILKNELWDTFYAPKFFKPERMSWTNGDIEELAENLKNKISTDPMYSDFLKRTWGERRSVSLLEKFLKQDWRVEAGIDINRKQLNTLNILSYYLGKKDWENYVVQKLYSALEVYDTPFSRLELPQAIKLPLNYFGHVGNFLISSMFRMFKSMPYYSPFALDYYVQKNTKIHLALSRILKSISARHLTLNTPINNSDYSTSLNSFEKTSTNVFTLYLIVTWRLCWYTTNAYPVRAKAPWLRCYEMKVTIVYNEVWKISDITVLRRLEDPPLLKYGQF